MNQSLRNCSTRKGIRLSRACCCAVLMVMLSSCGQNGPLFLPEDPKTEDAAVEQVPEDGQKPENEDEDGARH